MAAGKAADAPQAEPDRRRRPTRGLPPDFWRGEVEEWKRFQGNFVKTAGRIVERMQSNLGHMGTSAMKGFEMIFGSKDR